MVSIEHAQRTVLEGVAALPAEETTLLHALGRIAATDIFSPCDIPLTDNSAMDGYAFACGGVRDGRLREVGFLPAGGKPQGPVAGGDAVRIMTGAPLPAGCDTVVPIESVEVDDDLVRLTAEVKPGAHVRKQGEDLRAGDRVIRAGSVVRPQELAMAASLGLSTMMVHRRAVVAILATGDELLEVGSQPVPGRVVNSNSIALAAQVIEAGGEPLLLGIARDDREATRRLISEGFDADALVITGGVSVGDRDFVKETIEELGGRLLFWKVAMKPGKPVAYAQLAGKPVFALPGNPVAAAVGFEMFVRPALLAMVGHRELFRPTVEAELMHPVENRDKRPHLNRVRVVREGGRYHATAATNQGSANIASLTESNALLKVPPETWLLRGEVVPVMLLG